MHGNLIEDGISVTTVESFGVLTCSNFLRWIYTIETRRDETFRFIEY